MAPITLPHSQALHRPLRAFLYARVSRDPRKRGSSTDDQLVEGRRECALNGWTIVENGEFVDIDKSASRHARKGRPDYDEMVRRVRNGECDVIVSWEASRLHRDLEAYVRLRNLCLEHNVLWSYNGTVYDMSKRADRKTTALDAVQAEDEAEAIRDRVLRTVRLNAERGRPHGRILYGYARRYDPETGDLVAQVPHPEHAVIVRRIYAEFTSGLTAYRIAKSLNADGHLTPTGKSWSDTILIGLLKNPGYIGRRVHQGQDVGKAEWDAIVDELTWHSAQRILNDPNRARMRDTAVRHLLSGIARCGVCNGQLRIIKNRGYPSYACDESFCVAILQDRLEAYVEEKLVAWLSKPESAAAFETGPLRDQLAHALTEEAALDKELKDAQAAAKAGVLSVASLIAVEAGLFPRIEAARAVIRSLEVPPEIADLVGRPDADVRWGRLILEQKRAALRGIATIAVNRGQRGSGRITPGRVTCEFGLRR